MKIQKIQSGAKNTKGFTLVELIVVITILAILGTIAFISLQGQSAAARDSKRKTDLSSIMSKITITQAGGTSLLSLVSTQAAQTLTDLKVGGATGVTGTDKYLAGEANFTALGMNANEFKDPLGPTYKMGVTTLANGALQLAATLENDASGNASKNAFITGNYSPRPAVVTTAVTPTVSGLNLIYTISATPADIGKFKTNDTVALSAGICLTPKITSISGDLGTLTITCGGAPTAASSTVTLASVESDGLIDSTVAGTLEANSVKLGDSTRLPY